MEINKSRLDRVIKNMCRQNLSQIIISSTSSIYYLTGVWVEPHERMIALYIDTDGKSVLFGNEIFALEKPKGIEYFTHTDNDNPVRDIVNIVKSGKIGIDKFWASKFLIMLMEKRKDIIPVLGSAPVDCARMYKDEKECNALRKSSAINDKVVETAINAIKDGVKEYELASLINKAYLENGADCEGVQLVCFGKNGADPHHVADSTVISKGDSVIFDIFIPINRYWCDMTRTVFFKSADSEQKKVYELVKKANMTAESVIKPGMKLSDIDKVARDIISNAGYGKYFTHRLGHNLGIDCHEPPDVSQASEAIASPGMVFSIEPGVYLPGRFGVRIEDLVLVTEDGCEVLNKASKELKIVE